MKTLNILFLMINMFFISNCTTQVKDSETAEQNADIVTSPPSQTAPKTTKPENKPISNTIAWRWERTDGNDAFEFYDDRKVCFGMKNTKAGSGSLAGSPINGKYSVENNKVSFSLSSLGQASFLQYEGEISVDEISITCKSDGESFKLKKKTN